MPEADGGPGDASASLHSPGSAHDPQVGLDLLSVKTKEMVQIFFHEEKKKVILNAVC